MPELTDGISDHTRHWKIDRVLVKRIIGRDKKAPIDELPWSLTRKYTVDEVINYWTQSIDDILNNPNFPRYYRASENLDALVRKHCGDLEPDISTALRILKQGGIDRRPELEELLKAKWEYRTAYELGLMEFSKTRLHWACEYVKEARIIFVEQVKSKEVNA